MGWRFHGTITEERKAAVVQVLEIDPRLPTFLPFLEAKEPTETYRLLYTSIREACAEVGITVSPDDGKRGANPQARVVPLAGWYDDEVASALKTWRSLRRRRKRQPQLRDDCQRARRAYEKLRASKLRLWEH